MTTIIVWMAIAKAPGLWGIIDIIQKYVTNLCHLSHLCEELKPGNYSSGSMPIKDTNHTQTHLDTQGLGPARKNTNFNTPTNLQTIKKNNKYI